MALVCWRTRRRVLRGATPSNVLAFPSYAAAVDAAQRAEEARALRDDALVIEAALAPEIGEDSKPSRPTVHPSADETRIVSILPDPPKDT